MSVVRFIPEVESFAVSHPGRRRSNNEDAYLIDRQMRLFVVCDGMGGHAAGEVASRMAVETVHTSMSRLFAQGSLRSETFEQRQALRKHIAQMVFEAGQKIFQAGKANAQQKGMGTTLTMCVLVGNKAFVGHVGDSRCYLLRNQRTHQLTEDHTFFNEVKKTSGLEAARKAAQKMPNALSRALGAQPAVQVDTLELDLLPGDQFILCSDGLHGYLDDRNIDLNHFLSDIPFSEAPNKLIHFSNQMGGKDNITVVAFQIESQQESQKTQNIRTSMTALRHIQLFRHLDYTEHLELFNAFQMQEYPAGTQIIRQGDAGDALFILAQGNVTILCNNQPVAQLNPGSHFGEMALIDDVPRSATVRADTPCLLLAMSRSEFEDVIHQKPHLGVKMMGNLLRSLASIVRKQSQSLLEYAPGAPPVVTMSAASSLHDIPGLTASQEDEVAWKDAGEFMLPMESGETGEETLLHSQAIPFQPVSSTLGSIPFAETAELKSFQSGSSATHPAAQIPQADPFGETVELQTIKRAQAHSNASQSSPTHPSLPAASEDATKPSMPRPDKNEKSG